MNSDDPKTAPAWRGDWHARIIERVQLLGFRSIRSFLDANPSVPYDDLVRMISQDNDVAPVQLERLHRESAGACEETIRCEALDSMTRFLRGSLRAGWGCGAHWHTDVIGALAIWSAIWGGGQQLRKVKEALFASSPPRGWLPEPTGDRLLMEAFDRGWPTS